MSYFVLLLQAKDVYDWVKTINDIFIDNVKNILDTIGGKELLSARKTLNDIQYSHDINRELSSAITQLRLSLEKLSDNNCRKFQIALLVSLCYKALNEKTLSELFCQRSIDYFYLYLAAKHQYIKNISYKSWWQGIALNNVMREFDKIGIKYSTLEEKSTYHELFVKSTINERINEVVNSSKFFFRDYAYKIIS